MLGSALVFVAPAAAQIPAGEPPATEVEEIIVTARRAGAPIWTVERDGSTLILVGAISGVPRDMSWRPDALEDATARADLILLPQEARASVADLFRIIWRARTIGLMPQGQTYADHLSPQWAARLEAQNADERNDRWKTTSLLFTAIDLLRDRAGFGQGREGDDAVDVVRRAARRGRVEARPIGIVRGDEVIDSLIRAPQSAHVPCVQAAIESAEAGPNAARDRAEAWRRLRVADVVASPIDRALYECWPWGDPDVAPQLHEQWAAAVETAMVSPGVTLGVAPVRLLAAEGAVLDQLEARGFEVEGPEWKEPAR